MTRTGWLLLAALLWSIPAEGQEVDFQPGLIGTYVESSGSNEPTQHSRIDDDILFAWEFEEAAPNLRAAWEGELLVQTVRPVRFAILLQGTAILKIDQRVVLSGNSPAPTWIAGKPVPIAPGFHSFDVEFESQQTNAALKLYWQSDDFGWEPVPPRLLFHSAPDSELKRAEQGRQLYLAYRCQRCHEDSQQQAAFPGPALAESLWLPDRRWIIEKLKGQHVDRMPTFEMTDQEAADVAEFLLQLSPPRKDKTLSLWRKNSGSTVPDTQASVTTLGCLACHARRATGEDPPTPLGGPDLSEMSRKRSPEWLEQWLRDPESILPNHRMPRFDLTPQEISSLAWELYEGIRSEPFDPEAAAKKPAEDEVGLTLATGNAENGRRLVQRYHCSQCHDLGQSLSEPPLAQALKMPIGNWEQTCLSEHPDPQHRRPFYPQIEREPLQAYLQTRVVNSALATTPFERGARLLNDRDCLQCHRRGNASGLVSVASQLVSEGLDLELPELIPPSLDAVGDKLVDEVLRKSLAGEQPRLRDEWLRVRMPHFKHSPDTSQALADYLTEHDRLPVEAESRLPELPLDEQHQRLIGSQLIGAGGFSCNACHAIGSYRPKQLAIGTRGEDLMMLQDRMRPEFFLRWMHAPLRVTPGNEMPTFARPVPGVLDDTLDAQFSAIWKVLNDPGFEPPANPGQVEQFWQVAPGAAPRVLRDVVALPDSENGSAAARTLAVEFGNQHALLFDLDQSALLDWRFGDFAFQYTQGKSWYWNLAGAEIARWSAAGPRFVLQDARDGNVISPTVRDKSGRTALLESYRTADESLILNWELVFALGKSKKHLSIGESIRPLQAEAGQGGVRFEYRFVDVPEGYLPVMNFGLPNDANFDAHLSSTFSSGESDSRKSAVWKAAPEGSDWVLRMGLNAALDSPALIVQTPPELRSRPDTIATVPGWEGTRLPLPQSIMPTSLAWDQHGQLVFTSLKGQVYRALDPDSDGLPDTLQIVQEGLAAPFGILVEQNSMLVAHKPELLKLTDADGDGFAERRQRMADGWGYTDNYHDWVTGPVRTADGLFLAISSDYSQPKRDLTHARWRGKVIKVTADGAVTPVAHELRFPIGIAADSHGRVFVSDQQGVQNTFNEIDLIVEGGHYGVPARLDEPSESALPGTIQIPHPWTRSVNGIFFLPESMDHPFAGQGVGCEYNGRFLVRFSFDEVDGQLQGAVYPFSLRSSSRDRDPTTDANFLGPICGAVSPQGEILIGSILDSGWMGGQNTGEIVRLSPSGQLPNGIKEIRAVPGGFDLEFINAVDATAYRSEDHYAIVGYTRKWKGSYETPDSQRHSPLISEIELLPDGRTVRLKVAGLKVGCVYDISARDISADGEELFPNSGTYTLHRLPK